LVLLCFLSFLNTLILLWETERENGQIEDVAIRIGHLLLKCAKRGWEICKTWKRRTAFQED